VCTSMGVSDTPFCHIMRMFTMCCHGSHVIESVARAAPRYVYRILRIDIIATTNLEDKLIVIYIRSLSRNYSSLLDRPKMAFHVYQPGSKNELMRGMAVFVLDMPARTTAMWH
jgi:hypothetical protein